MKKVFAVLVLLMLPIALLRAQGLHGRILVVRDTSSYFPRDFENVVPAIYMGTIDSTFSLPSDLSIYDAVLVKNDTLSVTDQLSLIDYIKGGGKFYVESPSFRFLASSGHPNNPDLPEDTLLHLLGLSSEAGDALVARYSKFFGVDSEFTKGLNVPHDEGVPTEDDLLESYIPIGSFTPVLYGDQDVFAWVPSDTSLRAVVQYHPAFDYDHMAEYYTPFMVRVLCDYFGLCTDAVQQQKSTPTNHLRAVEDGDETWLVVTGQEESELDIVNTLGVTVFHSMVSAGIEKIAVPMTLPSGVYFARLRGNGVSEMRAFALIRK